MISIATLPEGESWIKPPGATDTCLSDRDNYELAFVPPINSRFFTADDDDAALRETADDLGLTYPFTEFEFTRARATALYRLNPIRTQIFPEIPN